MRIDGTTTNHRRMIEHPVAPKGHDASHLVTASVLVRQFGVWQERAARAPVYILHRGRPRLALLSVEILEALIAPTSGDAASGDRMMEVIDAVSTPLLLLDGQMRVCATNAAARAQMGSRLAIGSTLLAFAGNGAEALAAAMKRAISGAIGETAEIASPRDPQRNLILTITPVQSGLIVAIADATIQDEFREMSAIRLAEADAWRVSGAGALARITLRGYIETPQPSLSALTGLTAEMLMTARFASLFDVATRVDIGTAIEEVIDRASACGVSARLLVNRGDPIPVRVGLAPIRRGAAAIEGVSATIARIDGRFSEG